MAEENDDEALSKDILEKTPIQMLEDDIAFLRCGIGGRPPTKEALRYADSLEVRLVVLRNKMDRIDGLTVEKLGEWVAKLMDDVEASKKRPEDIDSWRPDLREEMFEALQTAWAAARFRIREAAETLGIDVKYLRLWVKSASWEPWLKNHGRRVHQVATLADLALQRMAHILSLDTNDPDVMRIQASTAKTVITAGLTVPDELPKGDGRPKTGGHASQNDGPARLKPPKAVPPKGGAHGP